MSRSSKRSAFVWWNGGVCRVIDDRSRVAVATSKHFRRATRKARNLGYDVRVYCDLCPAPRDATDVRSGGYTLPRKETA